MSIVIAVVALAVAVLALRRADVVERRARQWLEAAGSARGGLSDAAAARDTSPPRSAPASPGDAEALAELRRRLDRLESAGPTSGLSRVAVVRYDAFEDLGGRLSFSAAVVDAAGRGLVLTAIHGRSETRSYLKEVPVPPGAGHRELSPEEERAVAQALAGGPAGATGTGSTAGQGS